MDTHTYDISAFLHSKKSSAFCAEKSDLGLRPQDHLPRWIVINNPKRKTSACFELVGHREDGEGDILMWTYVPTYEALKVHPKLQGYILELFND